ncbi:TetR/AcrR family transcriptional regulator [Parasulfitobacter algicola]|uniref:TetR/AcrR family transcriptional regulator n=1 Tax=Parasulfitobacter algicola TaxID=2614809 RepID=A0ABX2IP02_9RHOB|nr:TetR/AcrR family transcriptional regulator [Sulfitobacter algicola]NSX54617.1 TetR/AcrR family transcriptional regulator [Sulfitobacter algicola]
MARKQGSHSEITGPKVHGAALRLFAQHGFAAVSMRQIAAEVDVQAGALYNYTPDKQSLLFDLLKVHMDELLTAHADAGIKGTPLEQLEAFTRFHIAFHLERTDLVFISYMELRNLTPDNFNIIANLRRVYENALEQILIQGQDAGYFVLQDTKIATMALIAMLTGVAHWYREDGRLDLDTVADLYWDMVRKSVGA